MQDNFEIFLSFINVFLGGLVRALALRCLRCVLSEIAYSFAGRVLRTWLLAYRGQLVGAWYQIVGSTVVTVRRSFHLIVILVFEV